jgi:AraC-like DNA-binding protein
MAGIERLLSAFDVQVEPFAICDVRSGWNMLLDRLGYVTVHYALSGQGAIEIGPKHRFDFGPDTIVIVPRGLPQRITTPGARRSSAGEDTLCVPLPEGLRWLTAGQGAPEIVMACGRIRATYGADTGIFDSLGEPIVERFAPEHPIRHSFQTLLAELSSPRLGTKALAETLMKQCLVYVLRRLAERRDPRLPWLSAAEHPKLGAALEVMLSQPERGHSVEDLAGLAGMSRSAFSARFVRAFGQSPHGFLVESRLRRAARLLATTELPIKTIAGRIGYRSRSNFSRAFKAMYGVDPAAYRRGEGRGDEAVQG